MRKMFFLLAVLLMVSCSKSVTKDDLVHLDGMWEIEKVIMADGSDKDFKVNEIVDKFAMHQERGTRTKVRVSFDGMYPDASPPDSVSIVFDDDRTFLRHRASHIKWQEEIIELDSTKLVIRNARGIEYRYKRHQPFSPKS